MLSSRMANLHPYVPGEQPKDRQYIKLNANENPYAPAASVTKAVSEFVAAHPEKLALYPDPDSCELRAAIAEMLNSTGGVLCRAEIEAADGVDFSASGRLAANGNFSASVETSAIGERQSAGGEKCSPSERDRLPFEITPEMIYAGNGSDEVLSFLYYAFFDSGKPLVTPEFSYSFYPVYAGFYGVPLDFVPLKNDWSLDVAEMTKRAASQNAPTIFANPNAPTGRGLSRSEIRSMLEASPKDKVFVVDEAYVDFGGESAIGLLKDFSNLIVVRTFSKSMCGAGMRIGYIVANEPLIQAVTTVKNSVNHFPLDAVAQVAGAASCRAASYYAECAKKIAYERDAFCEFLRGCGWEIVPSQTNFIMAKNPSVAGAEVYRAIKEQGILVRHFATKGIEDYVRITVGTVEQMKALRAAIGK